MFDVVACIGMHYMLMAVTRWQAVAGIPMPKVNLNSLFSQQTSFMLNAPVLWQQKCLQWLSVAVHRTLRMPHDTGQWVPDRRTSNRISPTAVRAEPVAWDGDLMAVGRYIISSTVTRRNDMWPRDGNKTNTSISPSPFLNTHNRKRSKVQTYCYNNNNIGVAIYGALRHVPPRLPTVWSFWSL